MKVFITIALAIPLWDASSRVSNSNDKVEVAVSVIMTALYIVAISCVWACM
jgi:hypothetical protein